MLDTKDNKKILEFINKYIGIEKYSYHQANIFISLFIGQYSKTHNKRKFLENKKDVTEKVIQTFAECTKYFTSGAFANLLPNRDKMNEINGKNKNYRKLLAET